MADFGQNAKGGPFAKFSKWPIFLAELRKLQKIRKYLSDFGLIGMYGRGIYSSF